MDWIKVNIETSDIDILSDALISIGICEFEIIETFDDVVKEINKQVPYWDFIDEDKIKHLNEKERIIVYVENNDGAEEKLEKIHKMVEDLEKRGVCKNTVSLDGIKDEDWVNSWRKHFEPINIGENIVISPVWDETEYEGKTVLKVDPGMIFGTGGHETTQLCISTIEKYLEKGDKVLDLGCGSGILSIIALMLGASEALGVDIDPLAEKVVYENAKTNGVENITAITGDLLADEKLIADLKSQTYDFVVANIVANVIIEILPLVNACLKKDGYFICSGIIDDRIEDVEKALIANGFNICKKELKGEWAVFLSTRG